MLRLPPFPRLLPLLIFSSLRRWPIPALRSYSFGLQGSTSRKGRLIPEASAPPWVQSDPNVWKDLIPLYDNSWGFSYDYPEPGEEVDGVAVLRRIFPFPSFMSSNHLLTFIESTRNASSGNLIVFRSLCECEVYLRSPEGVTPGLVHLAQDTETAYRNIVGDKYPTPVLNPIYRVTSFRKASVAASRIASKRFSRELPPLAPTTPVVLPPAPPTPGIPPPPITDTDLRTYIAPLVACGWRLSGVRTLARFRAEHAAFKGLPSLNRAYRFHDYAAARHFFHAAVATIPERPEATRTEPVQAGVEVRLTASERKVEVWAISELAEGAENPYGISHSDVRFAIDLETQFAEKWAGRADNTAITPRKAPATMEEMWDQVWDYVH